MEFTNAQVSEIAKEWSTFIRNSSKFTLLQNDSIRVSTPFSDSFGDGIVINIQVKNNRYTLSDQGYTIWNLSTNGIDVTKKDSNRNRILHSLLAPYHIKLAKDNAIQQTVSRHDVPQAITDLTQALINVSDLAFLNRNNTASIFYDDVQTYFGENRNQYSFIGPIYVPGKSEIKYRFEYLFTPTTNDFRLTKLYTNLSRNTMDVIIGILSDTESFLNANYGSNATLNILIDGISAQSKPFADGLQAHGINVYDFKNKDKIKDDLAVKTA
ncbi:DUF1828 domain-containing protein [uncultured Lacticaseibacillus sp.]|uniref:DUF1828 domain-containing protein n=1 Tax=uncultured Lacticaseibacillus sp. TaxID=2775882 RepID=UPI00258D70F1|nr:DUF1828 domain-containing protein [uncultured Lacticaseibacillus sp.]